MKSSTKSGLSGADGMALIYFQKKKKAATYMQELTSKFQTEISPSEVSIVDVHDW